MMICMILSSLPIIVTFILISLNYLFSFKTNMDQEKPSPFECGFNPITPARLPFSMQFFIISIIFLIFDIELMILIPLIPSMLSNQNMFYWMNSLFIIFFTLFMGLIYEWMEQSIKWIF